MEGRGESKRLYYLDHVKIFLTILVIVHHVGQAYGPTGGFWEYRGSLGESIPTLGRFFAVNAAFFMGFFFLIAGYFIPMSYDRNGGKRFLRKRLLKYGVPILFVVLVIKPLQMYFHYSLYSGNAPLSLFRYYTDIWLGLYGKPAGFIVWDVFPEINFGHAWFLEHLLAYTTFYWLLRKIVNKPLLKQECKPFGASRLIVIALIMAGSSSLVRIWYPVDEWRGVLGFFQVEIAHWPQYIFMFILGIVAYRKNWLTMLPTRTGYATLFVGAAMAVVVYSGVPLGEIWDVYESFLAVALVFGLITLFRERSSGTTPFLNILSKSSYAAYIFHFPVVLAMQYAFDKVRIGGAVGKFITVGVLSVIATYALSALLVRVKPFAKILV